MPLFGKSHKSPTDIVKALKDNLSILVKQDKKTEKVRSYFKAHQPYVLLLLVMSEVRLVFFFYISFQYIVKYAA